MADIKLRFKKEWLRQKIIRDPDLSCEAGDMIDIDKEIAEKVMGWRERLLGGSCSPGIDSMYIVPTLIEYEGRHTDVIINFHPSTNISDAWMVVEKMQEKGWDFTLSSNVCNKGPYECLLSKPDNDIVQVFGTNVPFVICLAALESIKQSNNGNI